MDDLTSALTKILSDPASMQQVQDMASALGLGDAMQNQTALVPANNSVANSNENTGGGFDLSALAGLLGGGGGNSAPQNSSNNTGGGLDLSALAGLLGGGGGNSAPQNSSDNTGGGLDLSALAGLLGGGGGQSAPNKGPDLSPLTALLGGVNSAQNSGNGGGGGLPKIDISTILKIQKAMSSLSSSRGNIDLLLALKPRLKEQRAKKVDDAIRVMQLVQYLPLIKESGLFGDMENILSGPLGGISSLLGGAGGGGISSLLGGGSGGGLSSLLGGLNVFGKK